MPLSIERVTTHQESDCVFHGVKNAMDYVDQLVEGWNDWASKVRLSDYENYLNGDIKFLFEYACGRWTDSAEIGGIDILGAPTHIPVALAECAIDEHNGEIRDLMSYNFVGNPCVVSYWGQRSMLFRGIDFVDQVEKFVPSSFAVGFESDYGVKETLTYPMGESVLRGYVKPIRSFAERELDIFPFPLLSGERRNNLPVGMVKRRMQVMDNITGNHSNAVYDGFVLFCERGALAGLCICFEDVGEGTFFADKFVKLADVFRSPIDL